MDKKAEATKLLKGMEEGLKNEFNNLRLKYFNPNTKGYEYEKILRDFFESYLGGLLDFYVRVPLIDNELDAFLIFHQTENEFDVVGTYKTAVPKIVLKVHETPFIPYDAVAFVTEVKQTLTKGVLESDLKKLEKLSKMKIGKRISVSVRGKYSIDTPLRILFYYERAIAPNTMFKLLKKYENAWDLATILMDDILLGNPALPAIGSRFETNEFFSFRRYSLLHMMLTTIVSLPCPPIVNTFSLFGNLIALTFNT